MAFPKLAIPLGLLALLAACAPPTGVKGDASGPGVASEPMDSYSVQQLDRVVIRRRLIDRPIVLLSYDKAVEDKVYSLIVNERVRNNLPLLAYDARLRDVARENSRTMATGPVSDAGIWEPMKTSGITGFTMIQTLVRKMEPFGHADYAQDIVNESRYGWINAPYRSKIFSTAVTHAGVGVYKDADGNRYVTLILMPPSLEP